MSRSSSDPFGRNFVMIVREREHFFFGLICDPRWNPKLLSSVERGSRFEAINKVGVGYTPGVKSKGGM